MSWILVISLTVGTSCGRDTKIETYPVLQTKKDLVLTSTNHPHGYQQTECFYCHNKEMIHKVDHLGTGELPTAIALVNELGISACITCHGSNGN